MTGPFWLMVLVALVLTAAYFSLSYGRGDIEAESPGTQSYPDGGPNLFFFMVGLRNGRKHFQP